MQTPQLFELSGRTALVTGGGRGLGRAMAVGLAEAGADVVLTGRKREALEETAECVEALGRKAKTLPADLSDLDEVQRIADEVSSSGLTPTILVNNAGRAWAAPTLDYPVDAWDRVFALNVRGLFFLTRSIARGMKTKGGGSIINVTSVSATRAGSEEEQPVVAYGASKGAVAALTTDLAIKLAPYRIRVNAIAPGPFDTDMMNHIRADPVRQAEHDAQVPLLRTGRDEDIKGAVVFLASEAAAYVTGHTLVVDGGISSRYPVR